MILNRSILALLTALVFVTACSGGSNKNPNVTSFAATAYGGVVNGYNAIRSERYDDSGALVGRTTYEHDPSTQSRTWTDYDAAGAVSFSDICRYNSFGREVDCDSYDADGNYSYSSLYTIENGLIAQRQRLDRTTDTLISVVNFDYDTSRNLLGRVYSSVDSEGNVTESRRVTYSYDGTGRRTSKVESFGSSDGTRSNFEYNDVGQLARIISVDENGDTANTETWFYDEIGNVIRREATGESEWATTEYEYETSPFTVANHVIRILTFWL